MTPVPGSERYGLGFRVDRRGRRRRGFEDPSCVGVFVLVTIRGML
jgi:hypothetical protein